MTSSLCISVRFLDSRYHGRGDGRNSEWPPSPMRLYQAMVAGCAMGGHLDRARPALRWLESRKPIIVSPPAEQTQGYTLVVPTNAMDLVTRAWSKGNYFGKGDANPATHRAIKHIRPMKLMADGAVHYLWEIEESVSADVETLCNMARNVIALGWGIDMVVTEGQILRQEQVDGLDGERWLPVSGMGHHRLRVPSFGTLEALECRYQSFLTRMRNDYLDPPPLLAAFDTVGYRKSIDPSRRLLAAFSLLQPETARFRPFDSVRQGCILAGMMRHVTSLAARDSGWTDQDINSFVLGHIEPSKTVPRRFAYLPLPSLEARGAGEASVVGSVRRVLVTALADDCEREVRWARQALTGHVLVQEHDRGPQTMLSLIPGSEYMVRRYTEPSSCWSTVTPVILPRFDKRHGRDTENLLRKAMKQAGFSDDLVKHADLDWGMSGYITGVDLPSNYRVPEHMDRHPRCHVRIRWGDRNNNPIRVPGPVCIGSGRFYGIGLFVGGEQ